MRTFCLERAGKAQAAPALGIFLNRTYQGGVAPPVPPHAEKVGMKVAHSHLPVWCF